MQVFQTAHDLQNFLLNINQLEKNTVGFVPTMGALHKGHISLINKAKAQSAITVCSIFVNPTQFNDKNDFDKYPIQLDKDLEMLLDANCDVVFVPTVEEIYPNGIHDKTSVELGYIGKILEAAQRPGHFEGVLQVVKRLLDIVQPDLLFLGQKDYQQCMVLNKLVDFYKMPIQIIIGDTLRETDGLAMSSRNARLNNDERKTAVKISQALYDIKTHIAKTPIQQLINEQIDFLQENDSIKVEYLVIANAKTLEPVQVYNATTPLVALVAAKLGEVRLIDNMLI